ncbi:methyltransferase domain-containing protein [Microlunatus aurantiacus]|uniref:Methyltransferase domain-containing protein n=1 Tax=Microlunatus aurantiacus TaxID=446786 RepID=A0ABP7DUY5_9ACTN
MNDVREPDRYAHGHHASVLRSHQWRTAENSAGYLLPRLRPQDRLLDVGTGPGTITVDLAERLSDGWVTGIDSAEKAVTATLALAEERQIDRITLEIGNVYSLTYADDSFDVAHAHQVLQHLSDPVAALTEMRRVVRAGGLVAARDADYAAMTWYPSDPRLDRWLELYHQVAHAAGGEPDAARRLRHWAQRAGFSDVTYTASTWCFADPGDVAWWSQTWAERVVRSDFAAQALQAGLSDATELAELSAGWRWWGDQPDAWFAVLHGELLAEVP